MTSPYQLAPVEPPHNEIVVPQVLIITPFIAQAWLDYNQRNRKHRKRGITDIRRDISASAFIINGDTIKFTRPLKPGEVDGVEAGRVMLIDGQHRLMAIAAGDKPCESVVVTGLEPTAQDTVDTQRRRSNADTLKMHGYLNAGILAPIARKTWAWDDGDYRFSNNYTFTKTELVAYVDNKPQVVQAAEVALSTHQSYPVVRRTMTGVAHYIFNGIDAEVSDQFFDLLAEADGLPKRHPVWALRNRLLREQRLGKTETPDWQYLSYLIRAWNALREGRQLAQISQGRNDPMPMPV